MPTQCLLGALPWRTAARALVQRLLEALGRQRIAEAFLLVRDVHRGTAVGGVLRAVCGVLGDA